MNTVINLISIITLIQLLLFTLFVFTLSRKTNHNIYLGLFLLSNAFYIAGFLIHKFVRFYPTVLVPFLFWGISFGLLFGPFLYFYTRSITDQSFKFNKFYLIHGLLFIIYIILTIILFHIKSIDEKLSLINSGKPILPPTISLGVTIILHVQTFSYMVLCLTIILKFTRKLREHFSQIDKLNLSWLKIVIIAFLLMWLVDATNFILSSISLNTESLYNALILISLAINFIFINYMYLKGLKHPIDIITFENINTKKTYENSPISYE